MRVLIYLVALKKIILGVTIPHMIAWYARAFDAFYALASVLKCPEEKKTFLQKGLRTCRFCNRQEPDVTFDVAHIFPERLGNKYLVSDFECEDCNNLFSDYESHLVNFLGPKLQIFGINGKKSTTTFSSADKNVKVHSTKIGSKPVTIIAQKNIDKENISTNHTTGINKIEYTKQGYIPTKVYKALLKIALSALSDEEASQYPKLFDWIGPNKGKHDLSNEQHIFWHQLKINQVFTKPVAYLYRKKVDFTQLPSHTFILYFADLVFQLYLPLHNLDTAPRKGSPVVYPIYPSIMLDVLFSGKPIKQETFQPPTIELNSVKPVKAQLEQWGTFTHPKHYKNMVSYDPVTGEFSKGESHESAAMVMVKEGTTFSDAEYIELTSIVKKLRGVH